MKTSNHQSELSIHCGKNTDSMEKLEKTCKEEAEKLAKHWILLKETQYPFLSGHLVPAFPNLSVLACSVEMKAVQSSTNWISRNQPYSRTLTIFPPVARWAFFVSKELNFHFSLKYIPKNLFNYQMVIIFVVS